MGAMAKSPLNQPFDMSTRTSDRTARRDQIRAENHRLLVPCKTLQVIRPPVLHRGPPQADDFLGQDNTSALVANPRSFVVAVARRLFTYRGRDDGKLLWPPELHGGQAARDDTELTRDRPHRPG